MSDMSTKMNDQKTAQQADRRTHRTQQALLDALLDLLKVKHYDAISVKDIIEKANEGRSTFYAHYQTKDDLLKSGFERALDILLDQLVFDATERNLKLDTTPLFRHAQGYAKLASSYFQTADIVINTGIGWFRDVAMLLTFGIGALMYYIVFYQTRLVPRWLSVWGLVGITMTIISAVLVMFHLLPPAATIVIALNMPILPQELVLAVWLIAKGFSPSAGTSLSAKKATNELLTAV